MYGEEGTPPRGGLRISTLSAVKAREFQIRFVPYPVLYIYLQLDIMFIIVIRIIDVSSIEQYILGKGS